MAPGRNIDLMKAYTCRGQQKHRESQKNIYAPGVIRTHDPSVEVLEVNTYLCRAANALGVRDDRRDKEFR
jgi:hypothetical protein